MFGVMSRNEAEDAISKAINAIEVEGVVDETLLINTKPARGKILVDVGREVEETETSNTPNYQGIQRLDYSDNLVKLVTKFLSLKEKAKKEELEKAS